MKITASKALATAMLLSLFTLFPSRFVQAQCSPDTLLQSLSNPAPGEVYSFGTSVAVSGNLAVVGGEGTAYVLDVTTGALVATLSDPSPARLDGFGSSVAVSGNVAVLGAGQHSPGGVSDAGAAYVFNATTGALVATLSDPSPAEYGKFGTSVAVSGNVAVVGARGKNSAYVFNVTTGALVATLSDPSPAARYSFGSNVAVSGNVAVVGAYEDDPGGVYRAGTAYVFNATTGALVATLSNPAPAANDTFGVSVAVSGNVAVVGADFDDPGGVSNAGTAYVFNATTGALTATLRNPDPAAGDVFGTSVAVSGNVAVVGAYGDDAGSPDVGSAYAFDATTGALTATLSNPAPAATDQFGDWFGYSVAISGNLAVVGAYYDDAGAQNAGMAYTYTCVAPVMMGEEIVPPSGVNPAELAAPVSSPPGHLYWVAETKKAYAVKSGACSIEWRKLADNSLLALSSHLISWPSDETLYQTHLAGALPVDLKGLAGKNWVEIELTDSGSGADKAAVGNVANPRFSAPNPGYSMIRFRAVNPGPVNVNYFLLIRSVNWSDLASLPATLPAVVGEAIVPPTGALGHDPECGSPSVLYEDSRYLAEADSDAGTTATVHNRANRTGPIIPVCTDDPARTDDDLVIAYYQKGDRMRNMETGAYSTDTAADPVARICWPYLAQPYEAEWPAAPEQIVIASQLGTGAIDAAIYKNWSLYVQNDPDKAGFNPNDEHALVTLAGTGTGVFALRNDLGTPATSDPYVLITYQDTGTNEWKIKLWKVEAEDATYTFHLTGTAGKRINPPYPLSALQYCKETSHVTGSGFAEPWRDRNYEDWAPSAGLQGDASTATYRMRFFYPVQEGFFSPHDSLTANQHIPWLDRYPDDHAGTPVDCDYTISWPANVPTLNVGESLVEKKKGLPDILGQCSVEIRFQESAEEGTGPSVQLIDWMTPRTHSPGGGFVLNPLIETEGIGDTLSFSKLPPSLKKRLKFQKAAKLFTFGGVYETPTLGESHLLLNVMNPTERDLIKNLEGADTPFKTAIDALYAKSNTLIEIGPLEPNGGRAAISAGNAKGVGYVTLAMQNAQACSLNPNPVSLEIFKVGCPLYSGDFVAVINPDCGFDEKVTIRHKGDFAGRADLYDFEWMVAPDSESGGAPAFTGNEENGWRRYLPNGALAEQDGSVKGLDEITIGGASLFTLRDNWWVCRYKPHNPGGNTTCGSDFSDWTEPNLQEGWIKRAVGSINAFDQRLEGGAIDQYEITFNAYKTSSVNTMVNMISQAGPRWDGNIAFNCEAAVNYGLIQIYESVLRRGRSLSTDGTPPVDYPPANNALQLVAGRLADLYMLVGNEAYADAADPTVVFDADGGSDLVQGSSIFSFMNMTSSLLEEELALLRGRGPGLLPAISTSPVYNRLVWNFTGDQGQVAYVGNYDIRDQVTEDPPDGVLSELDAKVLYPQGHGDAWGHYLMAVKEYLRLLHNPNFTWQTRAETVSVGGAPVSVDYYDERRFAQAAAALARTGAETINLTYRDLYDEDPAKQWLGFKDADPNQAWGVSEWGSRAGVGAYCNWVVANSLLKDEDDVTSHQGNIRKIDRTTVKELDEIVSSFEEIQKQVDTADAGLNPLGLGTNVVPFDLDPTDLANNKTHYEQVYDRAVDAMDNAITVFTYAQGQAQALRKVADGASPADFSQAVLDTENDFNSRLIEVFGEPYTGDVGVGKTYPTGYAGPDLYHYEYTDPLTLLGEDPGALQTLTVTFNEEEFSPEGGITTTPKEVKYTLSGNGLGLVPASTLGSRIVPGEIQFSRSDLLQARINFVREQKEYDNLLADIADGAEAIKRQFDLNAAEIRILNTARNQQKTLNDLILLSRGLALGFRTAATAAQSIADAEAEFLPTVVGLSSDGTAPARGALRLGGAIIGEAFNLLGNAQDLAELVAEQTKEDAQTLTEIQLTTLRNDAALQSQIDQLEQLVRTEVTARLGVLGLYEAMNQAAGRYQAAKARGLRLLDDRTRFRQKTAAKVAGFRYKDMAYRIFRNDALQKYRAQFDLAARYVYLAAKAYDYETSLLGSNTYAGRQFLSGIVKSRSIGLMLNGIPQISGVGDPGLADKLARMRTAWSDVKGALNFNNPSLIKVEVSLRSGHFRIQSDEDSDAIWKQQLGSLIVPDLLDYPPFRQYCSADLDSIKGPAIVIPFSSFSLNNTFNFFGRPAGDEDNFFSANFFATKFRSMEVEFVSNTLTTLGLREIYLVPVGDDIMRSPLTGPGGSRIRQWRVLNQNLPIPEVVGGTLSEPGWIPLYETLANLGTQRRYPPFRAKLGDLTGQTFTSFLGRSVWNTRWLLIIPGIGIGGGSDPSAAIEKFIYGPSGTTVGVKDIKLIMEANGYSAP